MSKPKVSFFTWKLSDRLPVIPDGWLETGWHNHLVKICVFKGRTKWTLQITLLETKMSLHKNGLKHEFSFCIGGIPVSFVEGICLNEKKHMKLNAQNHSAGDSWWIGGHIQILPEILNWVEKILPTPKEKIHKSSWGTSMFSKGEQGCWPHPVSTLIEVSYYYCITNCWGNV